MKLNNKGITKAEALIVLAIILQFAIYGTLIYWVVKLLMAVVEYLTK